MKRPPIADTERHVSLDVLALVCLWLLLAAVLCGVVIAWARAWQ